jgi:hypothetical protein
MTDITTPQIHHTIIACLEKRLEEEQSDLQEAREEYQSRLDSQHGINGSLSFRLTASFRNVELIEAALKYIQELK